MNEHRRDLPAAGVHGGDGPAVAQALGMAPASLLDLSQNLNPFAPDVGTLITHRLRHVRLYPDPRDATDRLAAAMGVASDRLLLTNGGSEAIRLVAAELGGRPRSEPDFALYPRDPSGPTWRSDPHSPSGRLAGPTETADVWDEAFYPLATGRWTSGRAATVVGSLTKTFACPGVRLGYLISDEVERFARHQARWSVGSLALAVVGDLVDRADLGGWRDRIADARRALTRVFERYGFAVRAAEAPWVLVEADGLRERLAPAGVLVRDCTSFGLPGLARVAVTDADGLERLAAALASLDGATPSGVSHRDG